MKNQRTRRKPFPSTQDSQHWHTRVGVHDHSGDRRVEIVPVFCTFWFSFVVRVVFVWIFSVQLEPFRTQLYLKAANLPSTGFECWKGKNNQWQLNSMLVLFSFIPSEHCLPFDKFNIRQKNKDEPAPSIGICCSFLWRKHHFVMYLGFLTFLVLSSAYRVIIRCLYFIMKSDSSYLI